MVPQNLKVDLEETQEVDQEVHLDHVDQDHAEDQNPGQDLYKSLLYIKETNQQQKKNLKDQDLNLNPERRFYPDQGLTHVLIWRILTILK